MDNSSKIVIVSPTKAILPQTLFVDSGTANTIKTMLSYQDKKAEFQYKRMKNSSWLRHKLGSAYQDELDRLKSSVNQILLHENDGVYSTYPSLALKIADRFGLEIENQVAYPDSKLIPWSKPPTKKLRPYQKEALEKLLETKHAAVSISTGLGKSFILLNICKQLGLKAVIMTPSVSIANQIYDEFSTAFGKRYVGAFFDSKKESNKLFVVSVAASLTRVEKGTKDWNNLTSTKVFIADESHTCPAKTLEDVCHRLLKDAPYRFFFSATQMRGDGLGLLLEAIVGPIVYSMDLKEGVEQGFLTKPVFHVIHTTSPSDFNSDDVNENTRQHLYYNPKVNQIAATLANRAVEQFGHPVLILVDEIEQFSYLLPHLKHEVGFAHGGVTKLNSPKIPKEYHSSDPKALVERFNALGLPILVGTSCISTGTDIRPVKTIIYLMGGKSEIQLRQAIGRGTRLFEGKSEFHFFDFNITNVPDMVRHATDRIAIYQQVIGSVDERTIK